MTSKFDNLVPEAGLLETVRAMYAPKPEELNEGSPNLGPEISYTLARASRAKDKKYSPKFAKQRAEYEKKMHAANKKIAGPNAPPLHFASGSSYNQQEETDLEIAQTINELSQKTLGSYVGKAADDFRKRKPKMGYDGQLKKMQNRKVGVNRALDKMYGEDVDLHELSKNTLVNYLTKASDQFDRAGEGKLTPQEAAKNRLAKKKIGDRRIPGMERADNKLNKEEAMDEGLGTWALDKLTDYSASKGKKDHRPDTIKTQAEKLRDEGLKHITTRYDKGHPYHKKAIDAWHAVVDHAAKAKTFSEFQKRAKNIGDAHETLINHGGPHSPLRPIAEAAQLEESVAKVRKALEAGKLFSDSIGKNKDGHVVVRNGFYYKSGRSAEAQTAKIKRALDDAGVKHTIVKDGEHNAPFRGGASVGRSSHFYTHIKLHEDVELDEARPDFHYQTGPGAKPKKAFNLSKYLENNDKKVAAIKKKAVKEDMESIDELSAQTKDSYVKKAVKQLPGLFDQSGKTAEGARKYYNRKNTVRKIANEDVEEIAELRAATIDSYRKKAYDQQPAGDDGSSLYKKRKTGRDLAFKKVTHGAKIMATEEQVKRGRGRPKKNPEAGEDTQEGPEALGYQLRKARSIGKPVTFLDGSQHKVEHKHGMLFDIHMDHRKTSKEKQEFQNAAHASHADFVKQVTAPLPTTHEGGGTGEIMRYSTSNDRFGRHQRY